MRLPVAIVVSARTREIVGLFSLLDPPGSVLVRAMPAEIFSDRAALVNGTVERVWQMSSRGILYTQMSMKLVDGRTVIIRTDRMLLQVDDARARSRSRSPRTPGIVEPAKK